MLVAAACGGYSSAAIFSSQPVDCRTLPGQSCKLSCVVDNTSLTEKYSVEWTKYSRLIRLGGDFKMNQDPNGSKCTNTPVINC